MTTAGSIIYMCVDFWAVTDIWDFFHSTANDQVAKPMIDASVYNKIRTDVLFHSNIWAISLYIGFCVHYNIYIYT